MSYFFLIFFTIYGSMHGYFFWKLHSACKLGAWRYLITAALVVLMLAPIIFHYLDRLRFSKLTAGVGLVGFTWLALLFWFCAFGLALDGWNGLAKLAALAWPATRSAVVGPARFVPGVGVVVLAMACWGVWEAAHVRPHYVNIPLASWPAGRPPLRIAQLSDLHLGVQVSPERLEEIAGIVEREKPDLIVSTGDLVDSSFRSIRDLAVPLQRLQAPLGKFAILGNHEFYVGLAGSLSFHDACGFRLLREESVRLADGVRLAGIDDSAGRGLGKECFCNQEAVLPDPGKPRDFTIFLRHQPRVPDSALGRFDLQLSGHTHGGQIFPFQIITYFTYRQYRGLYSLPGGAALFVSRGTGTWGPPMRVLSPPEVSIITVGPRKD
jgi:uncharacterized protein